jgi:hypothetical protein
MGGDGVGFVPAAPEAKMREAIAGGPIAKGHSEDGASPVKR